MTLGACMVEYEDLEAEEKVEFRIVWTQVNCPQCGNNSRVIDSWRRHYKKCNECHIEWRELDN